MHTTCPSSINVQQHRQQHVQQYQRHNTTWQSQHKCNMQTTTNRGHFCDNFCTCASISNFFTVRVRKSLNLLQWKLATDVQWVVAAVTRQHKVSRTWKMILVRVSPGIYWDAYADSWHKNIYVRTTLVFMIRSYSDKTFFFATCDNDEHCSMNATVTLT